MIIALLIAISILGSLFLWIVYRYNIELFACILIFINFEFFYLLPQIGTFPVYRYIDVFLVAVFLIIRTVMGELRLGRYGLWVILFIIILAVSIIVAYLSGQNLILGMKASKYYLLILAYFLFTNTQFKEEKFARYLISMGLILVLLIFFHYIASGQINVFHGLTDTLRETFIKEREGRMRVVIGSVVISLSGVLSFILYFQEKRNPLYLMTAIVICIEMLFINQTRMLLLAMFLTMVFVFMTTKFSMSKIIVSVFIITLLISSWPFIADGIMSKSSLGQLTKTEVKQKQGSYQARILTYQYYWKEILKHPYVGQGLVNFNWEENPEARLQRMSITLSDVGIVHLVVTAGMMGLLWFVIGLFFIWFDILRTRGSLLISTYIIIATITIPTIDLFVRQDHIFVFGIILAALSNRILKTRARSLNNSLMRRHAT